MTDEKKGRAPLDIDAAVRVLKREVAKLKPGVVGRYEDNPFTVLISCLLSLRTQDATTEAASERLFARADSPRGLLALPVASIRRLIYPVSFYRTKAVRIHQICRLLLDRHGGRVPSELDALCELPGVGRKTANLVVTLGFDKPGICVDTHVHRIANRWGYVRTRLADQTEQELRKKLPRRHWKVLNDLLVPWGQNVCRPLSPWCSRCPLTPLCPKVGVVRSR